MKRLALPSALAPALLTLVCTACATGGTGALGHHPLTLATLYSQSAAEFDAATRTVFAAAWAQLDAVLADTSLTALDEQKDGYDAKPPAIILDVDETVLDNSPYEARLIEDGTSYPKGWDDWCNQSAAHSIPGALEFTQNAAERGITVFYVTNRKAHLEDGTRANLEALGFPMQEGTDVLFMADERDEWTSDKTSRRQFIAETHRVVMVFGDNLGDFIARADAKGSPDERHLSALRHSDRWGKVWFMLPNPMYGYWDGAVLDDDYDRTDAEIGRLRFEALETGR